MRGVLVLALALSLMGCRQNDDPDGARALYRKASEGTMRRAPGFPGLTPSFTAHSKEVEIWINEPMAKALDGAQPIKEWPVGSIVKKDGYSGGKKQLVALMEKRDTGWYWAETDGDGEPIWSATNGKPDICIDCHDNRAAYSDWIYAFELPR